MKNAPKRIDTCTTYHFKFLAYEFIRFSYYSNTIRPFWVVANTGEQIDEDMVYDFKKNRYYSGRELRILLEAKFNLWINKEVEECGLT